MPSGSETRDSPSFGLSAVLGGLLLAQVSSLVLGLAILLAAGYDTASDLDDLSLGLIAILQVPLWLGYLGVPWYVARREGGLCATFGFWMRPVDVGKGLGIGLVTQIVLLPLLYWPIQRFFGELDVSEAARELTDRATDPGGVAVLMLIVAVGAPLVEEIFFRGLVQAVFVARFGPLVGVISQAFLFAVVHFQVVQLPGLMLFGLVAGELTRRSGRLGPAIWAHVGFNAISVAVLVWA
ncbi:MAG: CPBP family intramembrane metalloprotease [Actinomycetia bacterium]|nr:CPBP family intramembrane metalloprotease [Actinomycetes bacterium]